MADFGIAEAALALAAASAATGVASASTQSSTARQQAKLKRSQDELALARAQEESQSKLAKTLAARNALYAATGTQISGSALQTMEAASAATGKDMRYLEAQRALSGSAYGLQNAAARSSLTGGIAGSLLQLGSAGAMYASPSLKTQWNKAGFNATHGGEL